MPIDRSSTIEHSRASEEVRESAEHLSRGANPIAPSQEMPRNKPEDLSSISKDGGLTVHFPPIYDGQQSHAEKPQESAPAPNTDSKKPQDIAPSTPSKSSDSKTNDAASPFPSDEAVQQCMKVLNDDISDEANIARVAECEKGVDHPELVRRSDY